MAKPLRKGTKAHSKMIRRKVAEGWARIKAGEGYLYAAQLIARPDEVKIGFSLNPARRISDPASIYSRCTIIATMPGSIRQEQELHRALEGLQVDDPEADYWRREVYPLSILSHPAIPEGLRRTAA